MCACINLVSQCVTFFIPPSIKPTQERAGGPPATVDVSVSSDLGIESNCCFCCSGLCRKVTTQQQQYCTPKRLRCTALSEPRAETHCSTVQDYTGLKAPRAGGALPDGRLLSLQPCTVVGDPFIQDASDLQLSRCVRQAFSMNSKATTFP